MENHQICYFFQTFLPAKKELIDERHGYKIWHTLFFLAEAYQTKILMIFC